jgi:hypothetical protein
MATETNIYNLIIGLCILLRVYQLNIGRPSYATQYFLVLDFIVHFSHYMFWPCLAAIFRWFTNIKNIQGSHYIFNLSDIQSSLYDILESWKLSFCVYEKLCKHEMYRYQMQYRVSIAMNCQARHCMISSLEEVMNERAVFCFSISCLFCKHLNMRSVA